MSDADVKAAVALWVANGVPPDVIERATQILSDYALVSRELDAMLERMRPLQQRGEDLMQALIAEFAGNAVALPSPLPN